MKVLLLTVAALAGATAIAATATAQDSAPATLPTAVAAPISTPDAKKDPNARVCKTTPVIGSRVPSRVCMTRAEWAARTKADRENLEASQRGGLASCGTNPCS